MLIIAKVKALHFCYGWRVRFAEFLPSFDTLFVGLEDKSMQEESQKSLLRAIYEVKIDRSTKLMDSQYLYSNVDDLFKNTQRNMLFITIKQLIFFMETSFLSRCG